MKTLFQIAGAEQRPEGTTLLIELGADHLYLTEVRDNGVQQLNYYATEESTVEEDLDQLLKERSQVDYAAVFVGSGFPTALLSPGRLKEETVALLPALFDGPAGTAFTDPVPEWQAVIVHALPVSIHERIKAFFPQARFLHCFTPVIKLYNGVDATNQLRVHFFPSYFRVLVKKEGQLLLAQLYHYRSPLDVVYYLLKICSELELNQETVYLGLSGGIEEASALYRELHAYFSQLQFESGPPYSIPESEYPPHFFSSTFNLAACVS